MSIPRFLLPSFPTQGCVLLSTEDARHAQSVLRLKVGQQVQLFDGQGTQASATIARMAKSLVEVEVLEVQEASKEVGRTLELIVALPKGDRQKVLIDMLVQLGVDRLTPLECERSVAQPTDSAVERLQRTVIESCKQCGRNQLMHIGQPTRLETLCHAAEIGGIPSKPDKVTDDHSRISPVRLFAHPYGEVQNSLLRSLRMLDCSNEGTEQSPVPSVPRANGQIVQAAQVVIGPEGGLTDGECHQLLHAGWRQVSLGSRILRIETAAAMVASTWAAIHEPTH